MSLHNAKPHMMVTQLQVKMNQLNDDVINRVLQKWQSLVRERSSIIISSTYFFPKLVEYYPDPERAKNIAHGSKSADNSDKLMEEVDDTEKKLLKFKIDGQISLQAVIESKMIELICVPVHLNRNHWACLWIGKSSVFYTDSLQRTDTNLYFEVSSFVRQFYYLLRESPPKQGVQILSVAQQSDTDSCGFFMLNFIRQILINQINGNAMFSRLKHLPINLAECRLEIENDSFHLPVIREFERHSPILSLMPSEKETQFVLNRTYQDAFTQQRFQVRQAPGLAVNQRALFFVGFTAQDVLTAGMKVCNYAEIQSCRTMTRAEYSQYAKNHNITCSFAFEMSANKIIVPENTPNLVSEVKDCNGNLITVCNNLGLLVNAALKNDPFRSHSNCVFVKSNSNYGSVRLQVKSNCRIKSGDEIIVNYGSSFTRSLNQSLFQ
jgi:hypothetical protein